MEKYLTFVQMCDELRVENILAKNNMQHAI